MEIVIQVCNVCKDRAKPVQEYSLASETRGGLVHLCADDAASVEAILDTLKDAAEPEPVAPKATRAPRPAAKRPAKKVATGKSARPSRTATMEEIAARKKSG